jgi:hypothetical protein
MAAMFGREHVDQVLRSHDRTRLPERLRTEPVRQIVATSACNCGSGTPVHPGHDVAAAKRPVHTAERIANAGGLGP